MRSVRRAQPRPRRFDRRCTLMKVMTVVAKRAKKSIIVTVIDLRGTFARKYWQTLHKVALSLSLCRSLFAVLAALSVGRGARCKVQDPLMNPPDRITPDAAPHA